MQIRFKKLHHLAQIPRQATSGSAGFDLTAVTCKYGDNGKVFYDTGIAVEQQERKVLVESTDPEVSLPAQMTGIDSWKWYDWKMIRERLRRIMFANKRHIDPAIMARAMQKERTTK